MRAVLCCLIAACGSSPAAPDGAGGDGAAIDGTTVDDGTPMRKPCTSNFGSALTTTFGRLDGFLVAIVPPGGGGCNADSGHVHLQVQAGGAVYDIAVDVGANGMEDVHTTTRDFALPGPAWSEGWHTGVTIDYVLMGIHSTALTLETRAQLTSDMMADLATANHVSVYATGYGPDGAHLVHYNGFSHDGMIVTKPLSSAAHERLFSFTTQTF